MHAAEVSLLRHWDCLPRASSKPIQGWLVPLSWLSGRCLTTPTSPVAPRRCVPPYLPNCTVGGDTTYLLMMPLPLPRATRASWMSAWGTLSTAVLHNSDYFTLCVTAAWRARSVKKNSLTVLRLGFFWSSVCTSSMFILGGIWSTFKYLTLNLRHLMV